MSSDLLQFKCKNFHQCTSGSEQFALISSPIGEIIIISCCSGLHLIRQVKEVNDENFCLIDSNVQIRQVDKDETELYLPIVETIRWMRSYFENPFSPSLAIKPPFCISIYKTKKFFNKIWKMLETIPTGSITTYEELAIMVGSPRGARAAGMAMKYNPFQILVPCHRVLPKNRKLGQYSGGTVIKKYLLKHEKVSL